MRVFGALNEICHKIIHKIAYNIPSKDQPGEKKVIILLDAKTHGLNTDNSLMQG